MNTFILHSRKYGKQEFLLLGHYAYITIAQGQWAQLCEGGRLKGETLQASRETLPDVCRRWWRQRMKKERMG